ncbi:MAG: hypothetical protein AAF721_30845 [Myxococcota bacterium]
MSSPRSACVVTGVVHLAALGLAGGVLAPGTTSAGDLASRMAYVAADPRRWGSGWVAWMLAGLTMVWMVVAIRDWLGEHAEPRRLRLASHLIVLGAAIETVGHLLSAGALPSLAAAQQGAAFAAVERTSELAAAAAAFCFAPGMGIVVASLVHHPKAERFTLGAGVLNVLSGYGMAFVHAAGAAQLLPVATGAVVLTLAAFCLSLARDAGPAG